MTSIFDIRQQKACWSRSINDYDFIRQIEPQFRNSSSPYQKVYIARLRLDALKQATTSLGGAANIAPLSPLQLGSFVLEMKFGPETGGPDDDRLNLELLERLPRHPNIHRAEHWFEDFVPHDQLPVGKTSCKSMFIVQELSTLSLAHVVYHRKKRLLHAGALFTPKEVLRVARDISCALCLLNKELIAHRDVDPWNINIRLPVGGSVTREQVMEDMDRPGVIFALANFGSMFDFAANDMKEMKISLFRGQKRWAAHPVPPEITVQKLGIVSDYTKADVWSLGLMLGTMMTQKGDAENVIDRNTKELLSVVSDGNGTVRTVVNELLQNTVTLTSGNRWSCHDVYNYTNTNLVVVVDKIK